MALGPEQPFKNRRCPSNRQWENNTVRGEMKAYWIRKLRLDIVMTCQ